MQGLGGTRVCLTGVREVVWGHEGFGVKRSKGL